MTKLGFWPYPWLSALLVAVWLLLQQSLAPSALLMAGLLGWALPRLLAGFLGPAVKLRAWPVVVSLMGVVLWDIVLANFSLARLALSPWARPQPAWVRVVLALRQPEAVALLATLITTTPGTVSCVVDVDAGEIWVHALDCHDPAALALLIKQRYERPLLEIFA